MANTGVSLADAIDQWQAELVVQGLANAFGRYRCPVYALSGGCYQVPVDGCGFEFDAVPDKEGLVDCPNCGMWFSPEKEPETIIVPYFRPQTPPVKN